MFKNRQAGITIIALDITDEHIINRQLKAALGKAPEGFFAGMPFVADLNQSQMGTVHPLQLKRLFRAHGLTLIGLTNHRCSVAALAEAGLANIRLSNGNGNGHHGHDAKKAVEPPSASPPTNVTHTPPRPIAANNAVSKDSKILRQHIRSGQRIYVKERDLVIIGTVGAGAEIIADGNISVYGSLRGRAFAGAKGDKSRFIYCSELAAELIAIAGCYQTMEQLEAHKGLTSCLITLDSDQCMQVRSLLS